MDNCEALFDRGGRKPRSQVDLDASSGLYALHLSATSELPGFASPADGLIYIGKADGAGGLKRRCHFNGGTRNHSPRKSLAAILQDELGLKPTPILTSGGEYKTWGLEHASELRLDDWMHSTLEVSIVRMGEPRLHEARLISAYAPLLNLTDCLQTPAHGQISELRANIDRTMRALVQSRPAAVL